MSLGRLVWRQVWSHPVRSLLTVLAISVAMFLFCFLQSILTSLDAAVTASASNRIITQSAVSLFQVLPRSYRGTLESIDGVESVGPFTWFGGLYKDSSGFFAQFGADPETLLRQYPEVMLPEDQVEAFLDDRRGCVIGVALAEKYGWDVGDSVPLLGTIYPKVDESEWTFEVKGIYRSAKANVDEQTLYFHHEYLEETIDRGECYGPVGTGVFIVRVADDARGEDVAQRIDAYFDGGPQRTRTQTEAAFQADFIKMLGNLPTFLGMIVGAVLVAILFGVVNTMTIAARERTRTVGILKSLGFPDVVPSRLYAFESMLLVGLGTALGMGLALLTEDATRRLLGSQIPSYAVTSDTLVQAGLIGLAIALIAGFVPGWRAKRLRPVDALRLEA
jgi:putative ABC transport system permease protein